MLKRSIFAAVAVTLLAATAAQAQQNTLVFTAIPDEDETRLVERFTQYAKYFESKLVVPVKYLRVKSYPAAVTAFTNNQVQFAWFGGLTGVQARLIGDEPVSALDRLQGTDVLSLLKSHHKTLVLALHDVHHALAHTDRIVVLEHGRKVIDEPSSKLTANDLLCHFGGEP